MTYRFVLIASILSLLAGCGPQNEEKPLKSEGSPLPVEVYVVEEQQIQQESEAVGTVEAFQHATIASKVTGTISQLPVELGSSVKKNDLLVELKAEELDARLAQARTMWEQAKRNLEREQRLFSQNASAQERVNIMQDAFMVAESALKEAQTLFSYTTINAPFDGRISSKNVQAGDLAIAGAPLLVLENNQKLQVVGALPEELLENLKIGGSLRVKIPAASFDQQGKILEISPAADASTRTVVVKISLTPAPGLRPGQFARIALPGGPLTSTLFVPEGAVTSFGQMERVFVAANGSASLRLVRTGGRRDGFIEILSGLSAGDHLIVNRHDLLDGQAITELP